MTKVAEALAALEEKAEARIRDGLSRYGIVTSDRVIGVPMGGIQKVGKLCGRDHKLAAALWETGIYEARLLCAYVDDPALVTPEQMDRWARSFDNWAICDTLCFALFDRTPHAFAMVDRWGGRSRGVRQAHRFRFARQPRAARQEKGGRALPRPHVPDRGGGKR